MASHLHCRVGLKLCIVKALDKPFCIIIAECGINYSYQDLAKLIYLIVRILLALPLFLHFVSNYGSKP